MPKQYEQEASDHKPECRRSNGLVANRVPPAIGHHQLKLLCVYQEPDGGVKTPGDHENDSHMALDALYHTRFPRFLVLAFPTRLIS